MTLFGRVSHYDDPMGIALRAMSMQMQILNTHADNIAYADTPGYQRKIPVVTSFAETLGLKGLDTTVDTSVGKIRYTQRALDVALTSKGYFQKLMPDGRVELTRDGRFKLNAKGVLLSEDNLPILSQSGKPMTLPFVPEDLKNLKIKANGQIQLIDARSGQIAELGSLGIATENGSPSSQFEVRQGYEELSNVFMHEEAISLVGPRRNFQANRQIFLTQSQVLSRLIQEMGRTQ
jgi:flagellar basal body rod protein FlgG